MGAMIEITTITGVYVVRADGVSRGDIRRDAQRTRILRDVSRLLVKRRLPPYMIRVGAKAAQSCQPIPAGNPRRQSPPAIVAL
jgi:hypothetical protein